MKQKNPTAAVQLLTGVTMLVGLSEGASATLMPQTQMFILEDNTLDVMTNTDDSGTGGDVDADGEFSDSQTLTFNAFDSTMGTLTGVEFSWDSSYNGYATASVSDLSQADTADASVELSLDGSFNFTIEIFDVNNDPDLEDSQSDPDMNSCTADTGNNTDFCETQVSVFSNFNNIGVSAIDFSAFAQDGGGTFDVVFTMNGLVDAMTMASQAGSYVFNFPDDTAEPSEMYWSGDFTVSFTYDPIASPVPEPGTLALTSLGGLAGIGAGVYRRRKKDKKA